MSKPTLKYCRPDEAGAFERLGWQRVADPFAPAASDPAFGAAWEVLLQWAGEGDPVYPRLTRAA